MLRLRSVLHILLIEFEDCNQEFEFYNQAENQLEIEAKKTQDTVK